MNPLHPKKIVTSYLDYLDTVSLVFRDRLDQPSIQLAMWCEATLPAGVYRVRYRPEDNNFELTTGAIGIGAMIATWPDPGVIGAPKILAAPVWTPPPAVPEAVASENVTLAMVANTAIIDGPAADPP
jgi:hypothetical protein